MADLQGPYEVIMREALSKGFVAVSMEQRGPDGSEVLAVITLFRQCPVCAAVVPLEDDEHPTVEDHKEYHLREARMIDSLVAKR